MAISIAQLETHLDAARVAAAADNHTAARLAYQAALPVALALPDTTVTTGTSNRYQGADEIRKSIEYHRKLETLALATADGTGFFGRLKWTRINEVE